MSESSTANLTFKGSEMKVGGVDVGLENVAPAEQLAAVWARGSDTMV